MIYCHLSWAVIYLFAMAGKPVNVQDTITAFTHRLRLIIQRSQRKETNFSMARGGAAVFQSLGMGNTILSGLCRCADMQKKQSDSRWHLLSQTRMTLCSISRSIVCSFHSQTRRGVLMKSSGTAVWGEGPVTPLSASRLLGGEQLHLTLSILTWQITGQRQENILTPQSLAQVFLLSKCVINTRPNKTCYCLGP